MKGKEYVFYIIPILHNNLIIFHIHGEKKNPVNYLAAKTLGSAPQMVINAGARGNAQKGQRCKGIWKVSWLEANGQMLSTGVNNCLHPAHLAPRR